MRYWLAFDCRSVLGHVKFEQYDRRRDRGAAGGDVHHLHSVRPHDVPAMIERAGFGNLQTRGVSGFPCSFIGENPI
jgi:hypothetical protein